MNDTTICPNCLTAERSYDSESDSYFTYCYACFTLHSCRPYCHIERADGRPCGRQTVLVNGFAAAVEGATPVYSCPDGHGGFTRVGWAERSAERAALHDVHHDPALCDVRVRNFTPVAADPAANPARAAYARTYLAVVEAARS